MKRNIFVISLVLILLASACAPQGTPTMSAADIAGTSQAAAMTIVAQTLQALPTQTPVPPTETASPIPSPTITAPPLLTDGTQTTQGTPAAPATVGALATSIPTFTPQASSGSTNNQDPCNQPLTAWQGPTANFSISNQTKPQGTIVLSMYVVTEMGQCGYLIITGDSFTGPIGQYSAGAFITGKQDFKAFGSFRITEGSWSIVVRNDSILAKGGCYPNC
jgi:hypothetical protein